MERGRLDLERHGGQAPPLVLQPASAHDVAAAVGFARDHGLLLSTRTAAAYGNNYRRLQRAKTTYDPDNLFRVNRNIPPAA